MQTITINLYPINELSDSAKQKAMDEVRRHYDPAWDVESFQSIQAFCDHFSVRLKGYQVDAYSFDYSHDANNEHFRGIKLSSIDRGYMPTGYYLDSELWITFYDEFKRTGSALKAFDDAIYAGFKAWSNDIEWQYSDEHMAEYIEVNGYLFTEDGSIY